MAEKGSTAGQKDQQTRNGLGRGWGEARLRPLWPRPYVPALLASSHPPPLRGLSLAGVAHSPSSVPDFPPARAQYPGRRTSVWMSDRVFVSLFKTRMSSSHSLLSFTREFPGSLWTFEVPPPFSRPQCVLASPWEGLRSVSLAAGSLRPTSAPC